MRKKKKQKEGNGRKIEQDMPPKCCGQNGGGKVKAGGLDEKREMRELLGYS